MVGTTSGHLLESVPNRVSITFKDGCAVELEAEAKDLVSASILINGKRIKIEKEELARIPWPDIRSARVERSDLSKPTTHFLTIRFGVEPDVHGFTLYTGSESEVQFAFTEGRYIGRTVTLPAPEGDFGPGPRYSKSPGEPEKPEGRPLKTE